MSIQAPTPFGKYLLMRKIALGGMAEIFLAKAIGAEGFQREVVIKRILPSYSDDEAFVKMFIDEARISARLHHPNIVQIYDFDKVQDCYYIAMEYVEGRDLRKILDRGAQIDRPLPPLLAVHIAADIAAGLKYAHTRKAEDGKPLNIVHRDVSPHNILISFAGDTKLTDFGIAKAAARSTKTRAGTVKGKCGYMSPEQAKGRDLDGRSDMFALCTILTEMLTRKRTFEGDTDFEILSNVLHAEVLPPSAINPLVPKDLDAIVMKGLRKDRDERYPDMAAFERDLRAFEFKHASGVEELAVGPYLQEIFAEEISAQSALAEAEARARQKEADSGTLVLPDERPKPPVPQYQPENEAKTMAVSSPAELPRPPAQPQGAVSVEDAPTINIGSQDVKAVQDAIAARKAQMAGLEVESHTPTGKAAVKATAVSRQPPEVRRKSSSAPLFVVIGLLVVAIGVGGFFGLQLLDREPEGYPPDAGTPPPAQDAWVASIPDPGAPPDPGRQPDRGAVLPPKRFATVEFDVSPPNARLKVNGEPVEGGAKRVVNERFQAGDELSIEASAPAHRSHSMKKTVASLKETFSIQLEKLGGTVTPPTPAETGDVVINAKPWANVFYRGRNLGTTPVRATVPVGMQTFVLKKDNVSKTITLKVEKGSPKSTVVPM